jgi:competence protein ComEC
MAQVSGAESRPLAGGAFDTRGALALPLLGALTRNLEAEQERWFLWLPVMFGAGIALYFLLPVEPWTLAAALPAVAALAVHLALGRGGGVAALLAVALGMAAGKLRTETMRAPVLKRQIGPVDVYGFVELVEPRPTRGQRLTVRVTAMEKHEAHEWPYLVRK